MIKAATSLSNCLTTLKEAISKNKKQEIETKENEIGKNMNEYYQNPEFYSLGTEVLKDIIKETKINENKEIKTVCNILKNASNYEKNAPLLLSCFITPNLTFDECIKILSSLNKIPICFINFIYLILYILYIKNL